MDQIEINHNARLLKSWNLICDWCKANMANVIPGGTVASHNFETFGWMRLAVTQEGDVQLHSGSHGESSTRVYTRDKELEFDFGACMGTTTRHSHFCSYDKKPYCSTKKYLENLQPERVRELKPDATNVRFKSIEETIFQWPSLKRQLEIMKDKVNSLDTFQA